MFSRDVVLLYAHILFCSGYVCGVVQCCMEWHCMELLTLYRSVREHYPFYSLFTPHILLFSYVIFCNGNHHFLFKDINGKVFIARWRTTITCWWIMVFFFVSIWDRGQLAGFFFQGFVSYKNLFVGCAMEQERKVLEGHIEAELTMLCIGT